jgi:hypothetical protein
MKFASAAALLNPPSMNNDSAPHSLFKNRL